MSDSGCEKLHSAEFFGPERDYWWTQGQLELIASRLELRVVRSVLDVGCGLGHWGRLLASVLDREATIVGVDREPEWVARATALATEPDLDGRLRYEQGVVEDLRFSDGSFDLVTCQTLLIHVASPRGAIREMLRVTKPGGLIIASEPNNRAQLLIDTSTEADAPVEDLIDLMRFVLTCERGKVALGEGYSSIGDLLPGYLAEEGATDVHTVISEKTNMLVAPYESEDQQALRASALKEAEEDRWGWERDDALRYFTAGGGTDAEFETAWQARLAENHRRAAAIIDGSFYTAGGNILYLISARKPK